MNKEDGITRITLIIIVVIIVIGVFVFLGKDSKYEKTENEVVGYYNTQLEGYNEDIQNMPVKESNIEDRLNATNIISYDYVPEAELKNEI